jgi:hypothetical protein
MSQNTHHGLAMPNGMGSYIRMYNPQQQELEIDSLVPMPQNEEINGPIQFDDKHELLTESFKQFGQNRPVITYKRDDSTYWIIDGVRGWHAARAAGLKEVSCLVLEVSDERAFEVMQILNSGQRKVTYVMKAKKLELLEKHAKQYLLENRTGDNEASDLTVRQYMGTILQMCERNVSDFKAICHHPDKDRFLGEMDKGLMSLHKAATIARNKKDKMPTPKQNIRVGEVPVITCQDCPRRKEFLEMAERYDDSLEPLETETDKEDESEVGND